VPQDSSDRARNRRLSGISSENRDDLPKQFPERRREVTQVLPVGCQEPQKMPIVGEQVGYRRVEQQGKRPFSEAAGGMRREREQESSLLYRKETIT